MFIYEADQGLVEVAKTGDSLMGSTITANGVLFYGSAGTASLQTPDTSLSGLNKLGFGFALANSQAGVAVWSAPEPSADFDADGDVDGADVLTWQRGVGTLAGGTRAVGNSNVAEDGDVDADDLGVWIDQFGAAGSAAGDIANTAVPEPATTCSFLIAAAALVGFDGRRTA